MREMNWLTIIKENLSVALEQVDSSELNKLTEKIIRSQGIFLFGKGRTGLVTEMFAMRLTQLGFQAHLLDQPTTPALTREDLIILISGSGETNGILTAADQAKSIGSKITVITRDDNSSLAQKTDDLLIIPVNSYWEEQDKSSKVLNGTLFEQALLTILDLLIVQLVDLSGQTFEDMDQRHANLE